MRRRSSSAGSSSGGRALRRACGAAALLAALVVVPSAAHGQDGATAAGEDDEAGDAGEFLDTKGRARDFEPTYDAWFGEARTRPRFLPALLESAAIVGIGLLYYWGDPLANSEDWDDPTIRQRLEPDTIRFDTNLNTTNHLNHPVAGALVYDAARLNGLGIPASLATSIAWSTAWELVLEWREKPSVNDLIYTPFGGLPLGEFLLHLGDYLDSAPNGGGSTQKVAAAIFGAPRQVHSAVHGRPPAPEIEMPPDDLGFSSAYGHAFATGYDLAFLSNDEGAQARMHRVRIDAAIVDMPGFLAPGTFAKGFAGGNFSEMHVRLGFGDRANDEADLQVRATLVGRYEQSIEVERGKHYGHATMLGFGPALRFDATSWLGRRDQLSTVHCPGPQGDLWLALGDVSARFGADAYLDFGSIQSLAYRPYQGEHGDTDMKAVLQRQGYQYSVGTTARMRAELSWDSLFLSAYGTFSHYESIEGRDRFQERVKDDAHGKEDVLEMEMNAGFRVSVLELGAGIAERRRQSVLGDVSVRRWDRDVHLHAGLVF